MTKRDEKKSWEIPVKNFRQILFWPLVIMPPVGASKNKDTMCDLAKKIAAEPGWKKVADLAEHICDGPGGEKIDTNAGSYAEIVYFHDFVQRSLFARHAEGKDWPCDKQPIHLLRHEGIKTLECTLKSKNKAGEGADVCMTLALERLNIYLFSTGVAILVTELAIPHLIGKGGEKHDSDYSLADIMAFSDAFRRWHVPFWFADGVAGQMPLQVEWLDKGEENPRVFNVANDEVMEKHVGKLANAKERTPQPVKYWRHVLPKTLSAAAMGYEANDGEMRWRPFSDDRMATSTFITLSQKDDFKKISDGDWSRICFADAPGDDEWYFKPMEPGEFAKVHCLDWFWHMKTRHLFSGFSYAIVGASEFADDTLIHHFRRHYFQLGLMAQFEKASLLAFSGRITRAVEKKGRNVRRDVKFENRIVAIREDFIQFVHRFRFTGVSSQLQPGKMYQMWRQHLQLDALFEDVQTELSASTDYIFATDQRDQTDSQARLGTIATLGVVYGLMVGILALGPFKGFGWLSLAIGTMVASFVGIGVLQLFIGGKNYNKENRKLEGAFGTIALIALTAVIILCAM